MSGITGCARIFSGWRRWRLIQPWAFALATSWVVAVLYWRDSRSATLATLAGPVTGKGLP